MKKLNLSLVTILAMSTFAIAGGDIEPVMEPVVETPVMVEATDAGFYAGIAYGMVNSELDASQERTSLNVDIDHDAVMFQAGYQFNSYLAFEGRYWTAMGDADISMSLSNGPDSDSDSGSLDDDSAAWGIYLKPMYPVTEAFTAYALVGYGNVEGDLDGQSLIDESGFQWGLGASYDVSNNIALFVDYVSMYDDDQNFDGTTGDISVDSWNFGLTYKF